MKIKFLKLFYTPLSLLFPTTTIIIIILIITITIIIS